jgi:2-oxoglutarate dehydrogenase E2 component (dihydrolipoamide succinyltransferase)
MIVDVTMPQLGESVSEGTIVKWLVREGDVVRKDQNLVEVATDKADTPVPAPVGGQVTRLAVLEGVTVAVKTLLCQIDDSVTAATAAPATSGPRPASAATPPQPRATLEVAPPPIVAAQGPSQGLVHGSLTAMATPTARRAALEQGVSLNDVQGSGGRGRIVRDDVLRVAAPGASGVASAGAAPSGTTPAAQELARMIQTGGGFVASTAASAAAATSVPIPGVGYGSFKVPAYRPQEGDQVIPFSRRRRITADHMVYAKVTAPHVVTVAEVDLHRASRLREQKKEQYKKEGLSLTILAFVAAAVAKALRETPSLNSRVLDDAYVVFKDINLGVAVDSPDGLIVPVVRRADELGVRGLARTIDELARKARSGTITIDDLSGATFSLSNPGLKGNLFGGAIINQPNVGILRMGEIQKRVVVVDGPDGDDHMAIHPVMFMALSYDHRVVDGVAANAFLWRVTELIEEAAFEV